MMYHAYLILLLAIIAENVGTTFLKGSNGLTRPAYVFGALSGYVVNFLISITKWTRKNNPHPETSTI